MRRNVVPWLKLAVCGVVVCGNLALLATLMYPATMLAGVMAAMAFMPIGERMQRETSWYTHFTAAVTILALGGIFVSAPAIGAIDAVMAIIVLVQVHALIHEKRQRHYSYLMLMAFSQAMAASMMAPAPEIALVYLALVAFTVWALVLLDIFRSTEELGEVLVRGSLDYEARNGMLQESGARAFRRTMTAWVAGLVVVSVVVTGALFVSVPRTEAGAFGGDDVFPVQEFTTGFSGELNVAKKGRITEDRTALMRVEFTELPGGRFNGPMYWRVTSFNAYKDGNWSRKGLTTSKHFMLERAARFATLPETDRASAEGVYRIDQLASHTVHYEAFLTEMHGEGMPVLSLPLMVKPGEGGPGLWSWDTKGDMTVQHSRHGEAGISYTGVSVVGGASPEQLATTREDFTTLINDKDFKGLTRQDLLPKTVALTETITRDAVGMYAKLLAIEEHLTSEEFQYSFEVPELPEDHPIDAFIHEARSGHCQLFASAMALMARSEGLPCRLVSGYRGGSFDEDDGTYTISRNMAHVWVEVFFPDFGWIIFDPSPELQAEGERAAIFSLLQQRLSRLVFDLKLFWLRNVVGYSVETRTTFRSPIEEDDPGALGKTAPEPKRVPVIQFVAANLGKLIVGSLAASLAVVALLALRSVMLARRVYRGLGPDQVRSVKLYRRLIRWLGREGIECGTKTAEELRQAIADRFGDERISLISVIDAYNAARFGARPLPPERYRQLRRALAARSY